MSTVLVVDDDPTVREVVVSYLHAAGLRTYEADDGLRALTLAAAHRPDLVVLDLTLPGLDGLEVFRRIRTDIGAIPVVMLTARGEEPDRILGFEVGADDYVAKPFSPRELVLRVQSVLRRATPAPTVPSTNDPAPSPNADTNAPSSTLHDGDLVVDITARRARLGRRTLSLTTREFDLLVHLLSHPGVAFSREDLMREVWGWEHGDQSTVTVHVRRLREKIEPGPRPTRIVTVWGVGYRWDGTTDHPAPPGATP
ncbi:Transcriptional regulatory protein SrrA [Austwickia sp. TVS 96-490-7B]|uniref:response regulator transcription factor n=1 Tax=Austwickia sp. TVS 96-490-7B TaxID=2830843 RepID=UPI001C56CB36|nr:response regulator transcription factor [Austwickia sp. TVS 96-490-7B]MBW3085001.1 Transcriptional regulatory protein SrrA [Austwickia sp. TVS 96-490-7B]